MADVIILDTNVLKHISRGSQPVAEALNRYVKAGAEIYISRAAYNELVGGAPSPQMAGQYRALLEDLRIRIADSGRMADRVSFLADNIQRQPAPNTPGQIKEYGSKGDPPRPGCRHERATDEVEGCVSRTGPARESARLSGEFPKLRSCRTSSRFSGSPMRRFCSVRQAIRSVSF